MRSNKKCLFQQYIHWFTLQEFLPLLLCCLSRHIWTIGQLFQLRGKCSKFTNSSVTLYQSEVCSLYFYLYIIFLNKLCNAIEHKEPTVNKRQHLELNSYYFLYYAKKGTKRPHHINDSIIQKKYKFFLEHCKNSSSATFLEKKIKKRKVFAERVVKQTT